MTRGIRKRGLTCSLLNKIEIAEYLVLTDPLFPKSLSKGFTKLTIFEGQ